MRRLFAALIALCLANLANAQPFDAESPSIQTKNAKKISVVISCGKPSKGAIAKSRGTWTFTVRHGYVGKCSTDADARNSAAYVPYMERAEVSGHKRPFPRNKKLRIAAKVQVLPGVPPAHNTTILQIHQWQERCNCGPPVMMSFDEKGRLRARILRKRHKHNKFVLAGWSRKSFEGRWVEIAVDIVNRNGRSDVEIFLGGKSVLKQKALIIDGGDLYFKAGIYREGSAKRTLPTDRVYMKEPTYAVLN